jgi:hypothetical protein
MQICSSPPYALGAIKCLPLMMSNLSEIIVIAFARLGRVRVCVMNRGKFPHTKLAPRETHVSPDADELELHEAVEGGISKLVIIAASRVTPDYLCPYSTP